MADVSAKDSSQETLVNLAGLLISLLLLPLVSDCPSFNLGCFFLLTALHIYANYRAVRALVIETLNEGRLWLVLKHFLQRGAVLDPTSANQMEPLWTGFWPSLSLSLGVPLHRLISRVSELQQLVDGHQEPYLLHWDQPQSKCHVLPALDLPSWGQPHSCSSRAISPGQALDHLESVFCSEGRLD